MSQLENNLQWAEQTHQTIPEVPIYDSLILEGGWIESILWTPQKNVEIPMILVRCIPSNILVHIPSSGLIIGSSVDADLILDDPTISRRHAKLEILSNQEKILLSDLGSLNHTFFKGTVVNEPILLEADDEFILARKRRFKIEKVDNSDD